MPQRWFIRNTSTDPLTGRQTALRRLQKRPSVTSPKWPVTFPKSAVTMPKRPVTMSEIRNTVFCFPKPPSTCFVRCKEAKRAISSFLALVDRCPT